MMMACRPDMSFMLAAVRDILEMNMGVVFSLVCVLSVANPRLSKVQSVYLSPMLARQIRGAGPMTEFCGVLLHSLLVLLVRGSPWRSFVPICPTHVYRAYYPCHVGPGDIVGIISISISVNPTSSSL